MAERMKFTTQQRLVLLWLSQCQEWLQLMDLGEPFPDGVFVEVKSSLSKLKIEGYYLLEHELHEVKQMLQTIYAFARFFKTRAELAPKLAELVIDIDDLKPLIQLIGLYLDEEGTLRPNATPEFAKINREIGEVEKGLQKKVHQLYREAKAEGWTADLDISVRDGRLVLPILAEHKRKMKGIVHDESGTGQILYIEPAAIIEMNNQLRELQLERRREIEKILRLVSTLLSPHYELLSIAAKKSDLIDFIRAKAYLAKDLNAIIPQINQHREVNWIRAYHPLLYWHHRQQKLPVEPINLRLNEESRILVVSGPNAGGKSVSLKTMGLLQYMLQCGLPVPAAADSSCMLFDKIFIDIGDDQSLDNDLSTYSSHLKNMNHFIRYANQNTLILIDEFGTGTDPQFGGPIAESILEELNKKQVFGIVTTHYSNLKLMADRVKGLINGAMAYDTKQLQPLYKLEIGKPGSSFAFEVAQKIGMQITVIDRARKRVGAKQNNLDQLLLQLETEKAESQKMLAKAQEKEAHFQRLIQQYEALKAELETKKNQVLTQAKAQALQILKESNKLVENTIKELREADKTKELELRKQLEAQKATLTKELKPSAKEKASAKSPQVVELKKGTMVKITGQKGLAKVLEITKKGVLVEFGEIKTTLSLDRIEMANAQEQKTWIKSQTRSGSVQSNDFKLELDVRGMRGDEAIKEVIKYLDQSIMNAQDRLRILHGKGDGILRKLIRQELKKFKQVDKMEDEHADFGGDGITIVYLK